MVAYQLLEERPNPVIWILLPYVFGKAVLFLSGRGQSRGQTSRSHGIWPIFATIHININSELQHRAKSGCRKLVCRRMYWVPPRYEPGPVLKPPGYGPVGRVRILGSQWYPTHHLGTLGTLLPILPSTGYHLGRVTAAAHAPCPSCGRLFPCLAGCSPKSSAHLQHSASGNTLSSSSSSTLLTGVRTPVFFCFLSVLIMTFGSAIWHHSCSCSPIPLGA